MKIRQLQFALIIFSGFLYSCGEALMDYDINTKMPIVESYIQEGANSFTIKVFSMEEYLKDEIKLSKPISQLKVKVNQTELTETSSGVYKFDLGEDTIRGGQKYTMQFDYNGKKIEASTTVPSKINSLSVDPQYIEFESSAYYYNFHDSTQVIVSWNDPDKSYYQVYIESPGSQSILVYGIFRRRTMQPFQGNTYRASIREFRTEGLHTIYVYRVDKEYAELYERISASDLANPVSFIQNAFGVFTSMSVAKVNVRVKDIDSTP